MFSYFHQNSIYLERGYIFKNTSQKKKKSRSNPNHCLLCTYFLLFIRFHGETSGDIAREYVWYSRMNIHMFWEAGQGKGASHGVSAPVWFAAKAFARERKTIESRWKYYAMTVFVREWEPRKDFEITITQLFPQIVTHLRKGYMTNTSREFSSCDVGCTRRAKC